MRLIHYYACFSLYFIEFFLFNRNIKYWLCFKIFKALFNSIFKDKLVRKRKFRPTSALPETAVVLSLFRFSCIQYWPAWLGATKFVTILVWPRIVNPIPSLAGSNKGIKKTTFSGNQTFACPRISTSGSG